MLEHQFQALIPALALGSREHLAIVGGGGKSTLMFTLAEEIRSFHKKAITSTTTKVWHDQTLRSTGEVFLIRDSAEMGRVRRALQIHSHVFVGKGLLGSGKIKGVDPLMADALYHSGWCDYLLVEADGAAGRPLKAPARNEPVIPSSATLVVAMAGLEAIGKPFGPEFVFRMEQFQEVTGLYPGGQITVETIARLFQSPEGLFKGTPASARRVAFLNKGDLLGASQIAKDLVGLLLDSAQGSIDRVIAASIKERDYIVTR